MSSESELRLTNSIENIWNREAFRNFEASSTMEGQISAVEKMGASNIGESIDLIQNVDKFCPLYKE